MNLKTLEWPMKGELAKVTISGVKTQLVKLIEAWPVEDEYQAMLLSKAVRKAMKKIRRTSDTGKDNEALGWLLNMDAGEVLDNAFVTGVRTIVPKWIEECPLDEKRAASLVSLVLYTLVNEDVNRKNAERS
uniref:Uncharacterized protein n=1 Tax=Candidatus Kentrum sp. UNK TaxID=2126344 RepID=A0A451AQL2_9GAMM|nr:MAG: hypothetical protein BECKUNK1418G_GA0071005_100234 [Candidatus Kentron sp. UNK]VFK68295.1 MAG: hypothetical protein BECKUNK1418H_GA0071006_100134 [Candidatus Kentron sp. UNK]